VTSTFSPTRVSARARPSATERVTSCLLDLGATRATIGGWKAEKGFRFEVDGSLVDVLAPDGLGRPAMTDRQFQTIQIPGGTQALERSETVVIVLDGERTMLRRPTLLAAILLKARSLKVHSHPDDQREDLITLLGLMPDPRTAADTLKTTGRRWLRAASAKLNLDNDSLLTRFQETHLKVARASYALLTR
jgi:hypothetical protein